MQQFDVVVVGGGPAGGHCARVLARAGRHVLLVERHKDFVTNSFSSAGTPLETLSRYDLPESVVGSYWDQLVLVTSHQKGDWQARSPVGAVLDFTKLRQFLADQVRQQGGEVWMNCRYVRHHHESGETLVSLVRDGQEEMVKTRVLVDATGPFRSVIYRKGETRPDFLSGTGIEYLIEVEAADYQRYASTLTFFLGYKWIPRGYSWIFPMSPNHLKVGAGVVNVDHQIVQQPQPLKHYIELVLKDYMNLKTYKLVEVHGATLKYSSGLNDIYYRDNVIAIGDAVSTVNFLGGEGIRHAMQGAEIACQHIQNYLNHKCMDPTWADFKSYQAEMHNVFLRPWNFSEKLGKKKYLQDGDEMVDKVVTYLRPLSLEDVVDILFYYRFDKVSKGLPQYILRKLDSFWARFTTKLKKLVH
jgi:digeranylgeranylglycerophospholipid reductase